MAEGLLSTGPTPSSYCNNHNVPYSNKDMILFFFLPFLNCSEIYMIEEDNMEMVFSIDQLTYYDKSLSGLSLYKMLFRILEFCLSHILKSYNRS